MSATVTKQTPSLTDLPKTDRALCATVVVVILVIVAGIAVGLYYLLHFELNKSSSSSNPPPSIAFSSSSSTLGQPFVSSSGSSSTAGVGSSAVIASNDISLTTGSVTWSVNQIGSFAVNDYVQITWTGDANDYMLAVITAVNPGSLTITANSLTISPTNSGLGVAWTPWVVTLISNTPPPVSVSSSSSAPLYQTSSSRFSSSVPASPTSAVVPPPAGTIVTSGNMNLQSDVVESVSGTTATVGTGPGGGLAFASFPPRGNAWAGNGETWLTLSSSTATLGVNYTYSFWGMITMNTDMAFMSSNGVTASNSFWGIFEPNDIFQFGYGTVSTSTVAKYPSVNSSPLGSWFHLTYTFNGVTGLSVIYVNGSSVFSSATPLPTAWAGGTTIVVGYCNGEFYPLVGAMQCLHWSPNELNAAQISAVYQSELAGVCCTSYQTCITDQVIPTSGSMNLQTNLVDSKSAGTASVVAGTLAFPTVNGRGTAWTSTGTTTLQLAQSSDPLSVSYTVMFWVLVQEFMGGFSTIILSTASLTTPTSFAITLTTAYGFQFGHGSTSTSAPFATTNLGAGILTTWFHAAVTYSVTTGASIIYINGVSVASTTVLSAPTWTGGSVLQIGTGITGISFPMYGSMQCLHWDNAPLSASAISSIYTAETGGACATAGF
jgi:Concanavalin A-like lectin/glucanases superfamily